jgi:hypothetical protein
MENEKELEDRIRKLGDQLFKAQDARENAKNDDEEKAANERYDSIEREREAAKQQLLKLKNPGSGA